MELFDLRGRRPVRRAPSRRCDRGALTGCTIFFRKESIVWFAVSSLARAIEGTLSRRRSDTWSLSTLADGRTSSATLSKVIRPSLESASSVAASARVACLQTSRIEKPCFCALPDASCTLHSVDIDPEMSKTTMTSIAVFVAGASHLISTRAASSMPSTTRSAKLSCFGGAGSLPPSNAGEFGGAGGPGSVNALRGSRGDLFVMFF